MLFIISIPPILPVCFHRVACRRIVSGLFSSLLLFDKRSWHGSLYIYASSFSFFFFWHNKILFLDYFVFPYLKKKKYSKTKFFVFCPLDLVGFGDGFFLGMCVPTCVALDLWRTWVNLVSGPFKIPPGSYSRTIGTPRSNMVASTRLLVDCLPLSVSKVW